MNVYPNRTEAFTTAQELVDFVMAHLATMDGPSMRTLTRAEQRSSADGAKRAECAYRGDNGARCAIGACIPDDQYQPWIEGLSSSDPAVLMRAGIPDHLSGLARDLQTLHDIHYFASEEPPSVKMREIAGDHGVTFRALAEQEAPNEALNH